MSVQRSPNRGRRCRTLVTMVAPLVLGVGVGVVAPTAADAAPLAGRTAVENTSPVATPQNQVAPTPTGASIEFNVGLQLGDPAGAVAFAQAVSDPTSPSYHHYLTAAQWESRYSPTASSVSAVTNWLRSEGIRIDAITPDRLTVEASASAATIQSAFDTTLGEYRHSGKVVRLASGALTVPTALAPLISGITGVDESPATHDTLTGSDTTTTSPAAASRSALAQRSPIPQPGGFRNAPPCSPSFGQVSDTTDPPYSPSFPNPLAYAVCGYTPAQLQGAYGLTSSIDSGIDGHGVTVAIVDAYGSPTVFADAQEYSQKNQPGQVLRADQFSQILNTPFNHETECGASGWFGEETLDVEAVHATAPGANILYVGARNCLTGLYNSVQQVVDGHLADIITDSWGDDAGDLLDSAGTRRSFDNILLMAGGTGIGVQFSAGDNGDEFTTTGLTAPDYPPSSPYVTAVGGTSLEVNSRNARLGELGWSTSKSDLCTKVLKLQKEPGCKKATFNTWLPPAPGAYDYGGGGGTSYQYPEPSYQQGVVPAALAGRNTAVTGIANRVEPDISMDADPTTGMLVGETQTFPDGTYYDQYRIGGTSLSSPLFAGIMADADQAAGGPLGFVNPLLYQLDATGSTATSAFDDIKRAPNQGLVRVDYVNSVDGTNGTITSVRVLGYQGPEEYCSGTGNCTTQNVALTATRGFDSMTGIGSPGTGLIADLAKG